MFMVFFNYGRRVCGSLSQCHAIALCGDTYTRAVLYVFKRSDSNTTLAHSQHEKRSTHSNVCQEFWPTRSACRLARSRRHCALSRRAAPGRCSRARTGLRSCTARTKSSSFPTSTWRRSRTCARSILRATLTGVWRFEKAFKSVVCNCNVIVNGGSCFWFVFRKFPLGCLRSHAWNWCFCVID